MNPTSSTTAILVTPMSTGSMLNTNSTTGDKVTSGQVVYSNSITPSNSSSTLRGGQNITSSNGTNGYITSSYQSPSVNIGCLKIKTENEFVHPQSSGLSNSSTYNRAIIHSSLISNQPVSYMSILFWKNIPGVPIKRY